jgi:hypothetical protein
MNRCGIAFLKNCDLKTQKIIFQIADKLVFFFQMQNFKG